MDGSSVLINAGLEVREVHADSKINNSTGKKTFRAEETKVNFFDTTKYNDDFKKNIIFKIEKRDEDQIIEGKIDPEEWQKEYDRVYGELDNIEKDVELNKQRGAIGIVDNDVEECR